MSYYLKTHSSYNEWVPTQLTAAPIGYYSEKNQPLLNHGHALLAQPHPFSEYAPAVYDPSSQQTWGQNRYGQQAPTSWGQCSSNEGRKPWQPYTQQYLHPHPHWECYHGQVGSEQQQEVEWAREMSVTPVSPAPDVGQQVCGKEEPICLLMLAMLVAGIPVIPVGDIRIGPVLAAAQRFMALNSEKDAL